MKYFLLFYILILVVIALTVLNLLTVDFANDLYRYFMPRPQADKPASSFYQPIPRNPGPNSDLFCDITKDDICDPDCPAGADPDCAPDAGPPSSPPVPGQPER